MRKLLMFTNLAGALLTVTLGYRIYHLSNIAFENITTTGQQEMIHATKLDDLREICTRYTSAFSIQQQASHLVFKQQATLLIIIILLYLANVYLIYRIQGTELRKEKSDA